MQDKKYCEKWQSLVACEYGDESFIVFKDRRRAKVNVFLKSFRHLHSVFRVLLQRHRERERERKREREREQYCTKI